jgi:hypothetical protein
MHSQPLEVQQPGRCPVQAAPDASALHDANKTTYNT